MESGIQAGLPSGNRTSAMPNLFWGAAVAAAAARVWMSIRVFLFKIQKIVARIKKLNSVRGSSLFRTSVLRNDPADRAGVRACGRVAITVCGRIEPRTTPDVVARRLIKIRAAARTGYRTVGDFPVGADSHAETGGAFTLFTQGARGIVVRRGPVSGIALGRSALRLELGRRRRRRRRRCSRGEHRSRRRRRCLMSHCLDLRRRRVEGDRRRRRHDGRRRRDPASVAVGAAPPGGFSSSMLTAEVTSLTFLNAS